MKNEAQGVAESLTPDFDTIRDFVSMAAHDLREPLRSIRLGAHLLTGAGPERPEENVARGTRYVSDGVDRLETLIRDISEYCYGEVQEPDFRETELEAVLLQAQGELASELKTCGAAITRGSLPAVLGSFTELTSVFRSLITNACKFCGEAPPRIHIGAEREGSEWIVAVADNGIGFNPTYSTRIFRPFERLNGKQYPGSGLGLTIAQKIIQKHGGRIWAESMAGEGSIFRFSLPVLS